MLCFLIHVLKSHNIYICKSFAQIHSNPQTNIVDQNDVKVWIP